MTEEQKDMTLPEALDRLDKMQKEMISTYNLYHINVKEIMSTLLKQLGEKSKIIKP